MKYVCKKEHGMFKSILNLLCLKKLHENTKVLVNRKVWACSIDSERRGSWSKKRLRTSALGKCRHSSMGVLRIENYFIIIMFLLKN